jgi:hypothetical protein
LRRLGRPTITVELARPIALDDELRAPFVVGGGVLHFGTGDQSANGRQLPAVDRVPPLTGRPVEVHRDLDG